MSNFVKTTNFATKVVHAGLDPDDNIHHPCVAPIFTAATYYRENRNISIEDTNYRYGRFGNPTRASLEKALATLEDAKYGLAFAAGMGAISCVTQMLNTSDHLICCSNIYSGTTYYQDEVAVRMGISVTLVDGRDLKKIRNALQPNTKMIWIESVSNPSLHVYDIGEIHKIAKAAKCMLVVDNTFLTPYFARPLKLGADIVVYSLAKYMNGHTDVIMGGVVINDDNLYNRLKTIQIASGNVPSPFDCYQVIRGIKTLALRMEQHQKNSLAVAKYLDKHPNVLKVLHPGLPTHPQHQLALRQFSGHSGMVSFYLKGGINDTKKFMKELKLFGIADSLGGVESLMEIPLLMSHSTLTCEQLAENEITENFIRCSVGIEDERDLIEDLRQALEATDSNNVSTNVIPKL